jgi:hypothetical protein
VKRVTIPCKNNRLVDGSKTCACYTYEVIGATFQAKEEFRLRSFVNINYRAIGKDELKVNDCIEGETVLVRDPTVSWTRSANTSMH